LKVVWREFFISGGFPISGGFDQFCTGLFFVWQIWRNSGGFWVSINKKAALFNLLLTNFLNEYKITKKNWKKIGKKNPKNISKEKNILHGPLLRVGKIRNKTQENTTPKGWKTV
jgi:hypothetical protein